MKNKKIMVIATTDNMIWQFLIPHIQHMQSLGNTVHCVCAKTGFWFDELKDKYGFTVHEIDFARNPFSIKNIKNYKKLKELQKEENFDLVYCQQPVGGLMGRLIGKKFKIPVIYTAHGFHFYKGCPLKNKLMYKTVEKYLSKYTDHLITINSEDFEAAKKMKAKHVYLINGIGIDKNKMQVENFDKDEFRKEIGLEKGDFAILTISEMNKNKNYLTMLETIKILAKENGNIKFVSCGEGVWQEKIKQHAKNLGIESNCIFLGFRKDVAKIISVCDLFFHASFREGLTLSVMEAMSAGKPCVVSNVRGNRDLIDDNKGGFICEPTDAEGFAEKIKILMKDENLRAKFGGYNKSKAQNYTVEFVKQQLEEIYESIKI